MEITHHISLSAGTNEIAAFRAVGIDIRPGFVTVRVSEDDPRWAAVQKLVNRFQAVDVPKTTFSQGEIERAANLGLLPGWHDGYPQPADDGGYMRETYELTDYCATCGVGKRQKAPFAISKAPTWGKRGILQLNWIFDEYFTPPEVWAHVFKPFEIEHREVVSYKTGQVLPSVVQLVISEITSVDWNGSRTSCPACKRTKFDPVARGYHPSPLTPRFAIAKSIEEFGSGASAHRLVLISRALGHAIRKFQIRGVEMAPCPGLSPTV